MRTAVAITGMGAITALGGTVRATWEGLVAGRVGIGPLTLFDTSKDRTHTAAQIQDFDPTNLVPAKELRRASRGDLLGLHAAREAVLDAGIGETERGLRRAGVLLGGGAGALLQAED